MLSDLYHLAPQGRHLRRPGEEDSDVDIEGFEEDDDGKPKTPAPVRESDLGLHHWYGVTSAECGYITHYIYSLLLCSL